MTHPADALDGVWTITPALARFIRAAFPPDRYPTLLEIGGGASTDYWDYMGYDVTTVENDARFVGDLPITPLDPDTGFYDEAMFRSTMDAKRPWDIIVIDGPRGDLGDRRGILDFLQPANFPKIIVVDDTHRADGADIAHTLLERARASDLYVVRVDVASDRLPRHDAAVLVTM